MARISLLDVLKNKNPNTDAAKKAAGERTKKALAEKLATAATQRRKDSPKWSASEATLKSGNRMNSDVAKTDGKPKTTVVAKTTPSKKETAYPTYEKKSKEAAAFRDSFAKAKKSGAREFTFANRKYNTRVK